MRKKTAIFIITWYHGIKQTVFQTVFGYTPVCRQNPSCMEYTYRAIERHGTILGLLKGSWRALRCW